MEQTIHVAYHASERRLDALDYHDPEVDTAWKQLYRIGGITALIVLALIPTQIILYIAYPPPGTVNGHFTSMRENGFIGLVGLDLLYMISTILVSLVTLSICVALRRVNRSLVTIALFLTGIATAVYFASSVAFDMLNLSGRYAASTTEAGRTMLLAAGEGMLATYQGSAFDVYYILTGIAGLILAAVMLRSSVFGRTIAYTGLIMNAMMVLPPTAGKAGLILAFASLIPAALWLYLIARRLLQIGRA